MIPIANLFFKLYFLIIIFLKLIYFLFLIMITDFKKNEFIILNIFKKKLYNNLIFFLKT